MEGYKSWRWRPDFIALATLGLGMPEATVYNELAVYYEQLDRADRDGVLEADSIEDVLFERAGAGSLSILDVGCGVGTHLRHLETDHECVGLDLNEGVVDVASDRTEDATVLRGDMHALALSDAFDCITMLFHTLAYASTVDTMHDVFVECYFLQRENPVVFDGSESENIRFHTLYI